MHDEKLEGECWSVFAVSGFFVECRWSKIFLPSVGLSRLGPLSRIEKSVLELSSSLHALSGTLLFFFSYG